MLESQSEAQLRADTIPIRSDVTHDAKSLAVSDPFEDSINDLRMCLHLGGDRSGRWKRKRPLFAYSESAGVDFSSSSMISKTRFPRTTESSITNLSVGVYFRMTARATKPWMRPRLRDSRASPRFCCSGLPKILMNTTAE